MATFYLKRNDTMPVLTVNLYTDAAGTVAFNATSYSVKLKVTVRNPTTGKSHYIERTMTVVTANPAQVKYEWLTTDWGSDKLVPGQHAMEYEATSGSLILTFPNAGADTLDIAADA